MTRKHPRVGRRVSLVLGFAAAAVLADPGIAGAQLGTGWTKLTLTQDYIDTQSMGRHARHPIASFTTSGARYEKDGTTETFELYDPSFNRVEHDTNYHYRTGKVQFEGTVQIYDGVNHQFIVQNFNAAGSGPIMALSAFSRDGGVIIKQGGSVEVARNAFGRDIRVNIVHDLDANTLTVFIDGVQAWTGSGGAGGGGFNFKYGSYGSLNGSTSAKARWQNVQLFTGGTAGGGNNPEPAPDAGPVQDAVTGGDSAMIGDAASGAEAGSGAGGSGGSGGLDAASGADGGGTGGAAGSGGRAGRGGDGGPGGSGAVAPPPGGSSGCGCRLGGDLQGAGAPYIVALALLWALRLGRRQRALK